MLTVVLRRQGKRIAFTLLPMLFVAAITIWALALLAWSSFAAAEGVGVSFWNGLSASLLLGLAALIAVLALRRRPAGGDRAPGPGLPGAQR